jgi:hypothetical protein
MLQSDLKKVNEMLTSAITLDSFKVTHVQIMTELKKFLKSETKAFVCVSQLPWSYQNEPYNYGYQSLTFLLQ